MCVRVCVCVCVCVCADCGTFQLRNLAHFQLRNAELWSQRLPASVLCAGVERSRHSQRSSEGFQGRLFGASVLAMEFKLTILPECWGYMAQLKDRGKSEIHLLLDAKQGATLGQDTFYVIVLRPPCSFGTFQL